MACDDGAWHPDVPYFWAPVFWPFSAPQSRRHGIGLAGSPAGARKPATLATTNLGLGAIAIAEVLLMK